MTSSPIASSLLPLAFALAACSGTTPSPSTGTPAGGTDPAPAAAEECLASLTKARPEGWVDAGELVVSVAGGKPTSIEVRDASGKVLGTRQADTSSPEASRESLRKAVCEAGGILGVVLGKPPESGTTRIAAVRPAKEDEAGDLERLCAEPREIPPDFDLSQRVVVARAIYEETLTSRRYRSWLHGMDKAVKADDRAEKARRVGELSAWAKAAGKQACWFPDTLQKGLSAGVSTAATDTPPAQATLRDRLAIPSHVKLVVAALQKDPRTSKLVTTPAGVTADLFRTEVTRSVQQWLSARTSGQAWSAADGISFTGAALAALVDLTVGVFSDVPTEDQAALRAALSADKLVVLPASRRLDPNAPPACTGATSPCGMGPHAACCGAGQRCCAGGAAGNYYCWDGSGQCRLRP
jgi:hypothetical protein